MKKYYELGDRVISVDITPDTAGWCLRTLTVTIESGPLLSQEEYEQVSASVIANLVAAGNIVHSLESIPPDTKGA